MPRLLLLNESIHLTLKSTSVNISIFMNHPLLQLFLKLSKEKKKEKKSTQLQV